MSHDEKKAEKKEKKEKKEKGDKKKKVLLVTGVGGQTGGAALRSALAHPKSAKWTIRAGSRDPEATKAKLGLVAAAERVVFFKYDSADPEATKAALTGVTTAILVLPQSADRGAQLAKQAEFAFANGVEHLVTITAISLDLPESKFQQATGPAWNEFHKINQARITDIRPNFFLDNFWGQRDAIVNTDSFYLPLPKGGYSHVAVDDIGAFAAGVALRAKKGGKVYHMSGPKDETIEQLAEEISRGLGRPVKGVVVPGEASIQAMVGQGIPQHVAEGSADLFNLITEGKVAALQHEWQTTGKKDFEEYTTRPQITTEQWFKKNAGAFTKH